MMTLENISYPHEVKDAQDLAVRFLDPSRTGEFFDANPLGEKTRDLLASVILHVALSREIGDKSIEGFKSFALGNECRLAAYMENFLLQTRDGSMIRLNIHLEKILP